MTTRRDGSSRRSRNNRPPRSRDAELDFAGARTPWTPPCWRWRGRLRAFRDGGVRTKGQAAALWLQERANCSTVYSYEPNALAKRASPRLEQSTAEPIPGNTFTARDRTSQHELAGLLLECNSSPNWLKSASVFYRGISWRWQCVCKRHNDRRPLPNQERSDPAS